ncbi:formyltetrahydrofolate deformylase [Streptomyces sp. NPDC052107]|uniref:formyltetrahydrofolate deformylase n=1 Tax=Streptomyces sp. NPDC052107 TaxID=3155632 RepID=UPI003426A453
MDRYLVTLKCRDRPGIVRALADAVYDVKGDITESAQFSDPSTGLFCMRTVFASPQTDHAVVRDTLGTKLAGFGPVLTVRTEHTWRRALLMVSKSEHCLDDLLYRWQTGELPVEVPLVVSNHASARATAERYGVPFVHIPVTPATKREAEARLLELVAEHAVDFVVLARYMQVLTDELCRQLPGRIINIHHSFLPGFKGAKPYHQAHERGVKLIGATAHFVTPDLDEGPIIEQDVVRVGHRHTADELVAIGRDIERLVLARAVRLHAEDRVLLTGHRTVVFS